MYIPALHRVGPQSVWWTDCVSLWCAFIKKTLIFWKLQAPHPTICSPRHFVKQNNGTYITLVCWACLPGTSLCIEMLELLQVIRWVLLLPSSFKPSWDSGSPYPVSLELCFVLVLLPVFICSVQTQLNQYSLWVNSDDLTISMQWIPVLT